MNAPLPVGETPCDLRFGQVGLACVRVRQADPAALCEDLERRVHAAPQLFTRAAVVLDLSHLAGLPDDGTVDALLEAVRAAGMLPVGLAYGDGDTDALARRMGLPVIAKFREAFERGAAAAAAVAPAAADVPAPEDPLADATAVVGSTATAQLHARTVRSGQQIYARDRDLVLTGTVANGAEVIADGSIHIYGTLRGRALAGAQGDEDARIFCTDFRPELVSLAGHYRVFEKIPRQFEGRAVQCRLEGEKLLIETL